MPATPADIAAALRAARIVRRSDATMAARYPGAREQSEGETIRGYCDNAADAATLLDGRAALIGVERRRFAVVIDDMLFADPANEALPACRVIDAEQAIDASVLVARIAVNPNDETTALEVFG